MLWYIVKLVLLLPVLAGLIWGSLWLTKKVQGQVNARGGERAAKLVETTLLAPGLRLLVVEFHGRQILVGAGKGGLVRLAEASAPAAFPAIEDNL